MKKNILEAARIEQVDFFRDRREALDRFLDDLQQQLESGDSLSYKLFDSTENQVGEYTGILAGLVLECINLDASIKAVHHLHELYQKIEGLSGNVIGAADMSTGAMMMKGHYQALCQKLQDSAVAEADLLDEVDRLVVRMSQLLYFVGKHQKDRVPYGTMLERLESDVQGCFNEVGASFMQEDGSTAAKIEQLSRAVQELETLRENFGT